MNQSSPGFVLHNLGFTFITTLLVKLNLDNLQFNHPSSKYTAFKFAVAVFSMISMFLFLDVISYSVSGMIALRVNMLMSGIPLNSTINQVTVLFVALSACVFLTKTKVEMFFFSSLLVFYFIVICFSLSRQNILFILMFLVFLFIYTSRKRYVFIAASGVTICGVLLISLFDKLRTMAPALSPILSRLDRTSQQLDSGSYSRSNQFFDSLNWGIENPIFGLGIGGFRETSKLHGYPIHNQVPEAAINQLLSEHGVLFTLVFTFIYCVIIVNFKRIKVATKLNSLKKLAVSFLFTFPVLFLFNEIHYQASLWVMYLIFSNFLRNSPLPEPSNAIFVQRKISI